MWFWEKPGKAAHLTAGQQAEDRALAYLQKQGLRLLDRNYRCKGGEIDLVMREGETLVFVEVRYRASTSHGGALASVGNRKQGRLIIAASHYLVSKSQDRPSRFDVIAVSPGAGLVGIEWVKDAFQTH